MSNAASIAARAEAAYLGLALGDALGATVEFMTPREIRVRYGVHRDIRGGGWLRLRAGAVTDDTTMSLALGRAILEEGRIDALACARAFDAWMRAKPVDIGNTVRRNLVAFRRTGDPAALPFEHDAGNGAVMRVLPVALATLGRDEEAVRAATRAQAHVTHNNAASDAAAEFVVLALRDALSGRGLREVYRRRIQPFVAAHPAFAFRPRRRDNPSGWVVETMQAVLQALLDSGNFEECLVNVVNRGGDADTTGAIAGMLAGALYGREALPGRWLRALDPDVREACIAQARRLVALDGSPSVSVVGSRQVISSVVADRLPASHTQEGYAMAKQYRLVLRSKDVPGPVSQRLCGAEDRFEVRELTTRNRVEISVQEISLYRHSIFLDGEEFQILNLVGN